MTGLAPTRSTARSRAWSSQLEARATEIQERWRQGGHPDAAAALASDPELAAARPLAIELAYEEFCLREEAGDSLDPQSFAARFSFSNSLLRLIELHGLFDRHPDLLTTGRPYTQYHAGDRLGECEVVRPLAAGGFADVYLARDLSAGRRGVVLKLTARDDAEADTLGPLSHPHLMPVLSSTRVTAGRMLVMPFLGVQTLDTLLARQATREPLRSAADVIAFASTGRLPNDPELAHSPALHVTAGEKYLKTVQRIAAGVAAALAHLHVRGVAHRDVKPSNVLLGGSGHPYLLDFNLATADPDGRPAGTLPYLAPELLAGLVSDDVSGRIEGAADVYALGVLVWELLTGSHPYWSEATPPNPSSRVLCAERAYELQKAFYPHDPPVPTGVPSPVWRLVVRCLAECPADRPTSEECARVLATVAAGTRKSWVFNGLIAAGVVGSSFLVWGGTRSAHLAEPVVEAPPASAFERGMFFYTRDEYDLAAAAFAESARQRQNGHDYACAAYCTARGAYSPLYAEHYARLAIRHGYDGPTVRQTLAYCLLQMGHLPEAREESERVIADLPDSPFAHLLRGGIELEQARTSRRLVDREILNQACEVVDTETGRREVVGTGWLVLATMCVSVQDRQPEDLDRAVELVRRGVQSGLNVLEIDGTRSVSTAIRHHRNYQSALAAAPDPNYPRHHIYLISPIP